MHTYVHIPEAFFHYLWKYRLLSNDLKTINREQINIIHPGVHNTDSGPDFLFAKIKIGNTIWAGNVEIHVRASDWYKHQHEKDEAYDNLILHVVAENDAVVKNTKGLELQTICIADAFDLNLLSRYREIMNNLLWIPCQNQIGNIPTVFLTSRIHADAIQRLLEKSERIKKELVHLKMDWEECCYRMISRQFGARINIPSFEMLTKTLSVRVLMKHHGDPFSIEALLFGQSGLLNIRLKERYPQALKKEHAYLSSKYGLSPMPGYLWKFMRLRPAAFPSLRIAQMAVLYTKYQSIFQEIIERKGINSLYDLFNLEASGYWDCHYIFNKKAKNCKKRFGKQSIQLLLINAIIPLIHLYGQVMKKPELCERALQFLEAIPAENNAIIRQWSSIGIQPSNSMESQGLLQLQKQRCDKKLCLECSIGHQLLKQHK